MSAILSFIICILIILVLTVKFRMPPFVSLVGAAFLFGAMEGVGMGLLASTVTGGAASIFKVLGIIVFSGVVIARVLRESGNIDRIVFDVQKRIKAPTRTGGLIGYILSVPLMCGITTFVLVSPILSRFNVNKDVLKHTLFASSIGATLSYVLIYPSPVVVTIVDGLADHIADPWKIDLFTVPLSLVLILVFLCSVGALLKRRGTVESMGRIQEPDVERWRAWLPVLMPFILIGVGLVFPPLSFLSNINIALFGSLLLALAVVGRDVRSKALHEGTKNAGLIIFDLCGAGAFGAVIAASSFPDEVFDLLVGVIPPILLPFILAMSIQAAQGSRVVTATVTTSIIVTTTLPFTLDPVALVLMICGGAFMFSTVTDPFFWLITRVTHEDVRTVSWRYTVPLLCAGTVTMLAGLIVQAF
ncbi:MAG: GntP family permease [Euryarchaeota archaeon]|nr:GntP family permease [Euryarchaeota archaeon]